MYGLLKSNPKYKYYRTTYSSDKNYQMSIYHLRYKKFRCVKSVLGDIEISKFRLFSHPPTPYQPQMPSYIKIIMSNKSSKKRKTKNKNVKKKNQNKKSCLKCITSFSLYLSSVIKINEKIWNVSMRQKRVMSVEYASNACRNVKHKNFEKIFYSLSFSFSSFSFSSKLFFFNAW